MKIIFNLFLIIFITIVMSMQLPEDRYYGKVIWYDSTKGFGLIETLEGNKLLFREINLRPETKVTFEIENKNNYLTATKIRII